MEEYDTSSQENIVLVDGFEIRNTLDTDFGLVHRHNYEINWYSPKFYIPEDEVWVDHLYTDEIDFLLTADAFTEADDQRSYQERRELAKKELTTKEPPPLFIKRTEENGALTVCYVDGKIIRTHFDPEFMLGGHDLVYEYIPKNHIWLDAKMDQREFPYILYHEMVERERMAQGELYESAHEYATTAERELRRKRGVGFYPGDPSYPWHHFSHTEIIRANYIVNRPIKKHPVQVTHFSQSHSMCGPASLKIALSAFGKEVTEEACSKLAEANTEHGTEHEGMVAAAKGMGATVVEGENASLSIIERFVKEEKVPVIIGWFDKDGDHYSVVIDITDTHVVLSDPSWDTPERYIDRTLFENPESEFLSVWFDFVGKESARVSRRWYMAITSVS